MIKPINKSFENQILYTGIEDFYCYLHRGLMDSTEAILVLEVELWYLYKERFLNAPYRNMKNIDLLFPSEAKLIRL